MLKSQGGGVVSYNVSPPRATIQVASRSILTHKHPRVLTAASPRTNILPSSIESSRVPLKNTNIWVSVAQRRLHSINKKQTEKIKISWQGIR
mmetsp:Transcript_74212/g.131041  ORF Transcript_74212/g.131041 Transcript_74212/m.131041 type:complete len:92 (-) Transcript_74212:311-586(-)